MGNIPLHFNCLCPIKDDEKENRLKRLEYDTERNIEKINDIQQSIDSSIIKLENKMGRIEDKIDIKFEMLFLNMKIKT